MSHVSYASIPGFSGYRAGDDGSVWCRRGRGGLRGRLQNKWRRLKEFPTTHGGRQVELYTGKGRVRRSVHVLVLLAFVGPCPEGMESSHLNDIASDNRLENLKWDTPTGNTRQRQLNGKYLRGEQHHLAKLTAAQVQWARDNYPRLTQRAIAERLGVTPQAIWLIVHNKKWRTLP